MYAQNTDSFGQFFSLAFSSLIVPAGVLPLGDTVVDDRKGSKTFSKKEIARLNAFFGMMLFCMETKGMDNCKRSHNSFGEKAVLIAAYIASKVFSKKNDENGFKNDLAMVIDYVKENVNKKSDLILLSDLINSGRYRISFTIDEGEQESLRNWLFQRDNYKVDAFEFVKENAGKFLDGGLFFKLESILYDMREKGWIATGNIGKGDEVFNVPTVALLRMIILQTLMSSSDATYRDDEVVFRLSWKSMICMCGVEMDVPSDRDLFVFGPLEISDYPGATPETSGPFFSSLKVGDSIIYYSDIRGMSLGIVSLVSLYYKAMINQRGREKVIAVSHDVDEGVADHIGRLFSEDIVFDYGNTRELEHIRLYGNRYHVDPDEAIEFIHTALQPLLAERSDVVAGVFREM